MIDVNQTIRTLHARKAVSDHQERKRDHAAFQDAVDCIEELQSRLNYNLGYHDGMTSLRLDDEKAKKQEPADD